jgi:hypothetical protein
MSDQTSIFNESQASATQTQTQTATNSNSGVAPNNADFADLLGQIKNERGEPKYKSVQDALNGLLHAQQYISTLTTEKQQQQEELRRAQAEAERIRTLEETLERFTSQQTQAQNTTQPVIDESKIAEWVTRTLTAKEQEGLANRNIASVVSNLQQVFGADAEQKFYGKATEMGLSKDDMNALAAKSPNAVLAMLGVQAKQTNQSSVVTPTSGSINSSAVQPNPQSFIGRNDKTALIGATTDDVRYAAERANKMVEELHAQGKTIHDLTDPKVYFKQFGKN